MAAVVEIRRLTSNGPTSTDVTGVNTRVDAEDSHSTNRLSDPVIILPSGDAYSVWCVLRPEVTTPPVTLVSNMKVYPGVPDPTYFKGDVTAVGYSATDYVANPNPAIQLSTGNYADLESAPVELSTLLAAGRALTGTRSTNGSWATMFVYQFVVGDAATPGLTQEATLYFQYDET